MPTTSRREFLSLAGSASGSGAVGLRARQAARRSPPWAPTTSSTSSSRAARCSIPARTCGPSATSASAIGLIEALEADIPADKAQRVLSAAGKLVTPGLIDLHAHVFPYGSAIGIPADELLPFQGTTTLVSAGDAGANNFAAFRRAVVGQTRARALCLRAHRQHRASPASRCPSSTTSTTPRPRPPPRRWPRTPTSCSASRCA